MSWLDDDRFDEMRDHDVLLGLERPTMLGTVTEHCTTHGAWRSYRLGDECPECLRDELFAREGRWSDDMPTRLVPPGQVPR